MENEILEKINEYEKRINNITKTDDMKLLVNEMFKDTEILDDTDFNDLIYNCVIPKLKDLGITFDEDKIDYEEIIKENY